MDLGIFGTKICGKNGTEIILVDVKNSRQFDWQIIDKIDTFWVISSFWQRYLLRRWHRVHNGDSQANKLIKISIEYKWEIEKTKDYI